MEKTNRTLFAREKLVEQEVKYQTAKRLAAGEGPLAAILEEERRKEEEKVKEGEEWALSLSEFIRTATGEEVVGVEYVGFKSGRRSFELICL
jgi:deoxyribose-phosphate aldolase